MHPYRTVAAVVALSLTTLASDLAGAPPPGQVCQVNKNKEAGKYDACRQNAEASFAKSGDAGKYATALAKCLAKFQAGWAKHEAKAAKKGAVCPSTGDATSIAALIEDHTTTIASLLAGGMPADCSSALATCTADLEACEAAGTTEGARLRTGQTTCYDAAGGVVGCPSSGQDGEALKGLTRFYLDNGDGTMTDIRTGLMWEKHADDGSIHDLDTQFSWVDAFGKIAALNAGSGFAGHTDWRLPNVNELQSLIDYGRFGPSVPLVFHTGCTPDCTVLDCSCTKTGDHWTSTSFHNLASQAWFVSSDSGAVGHGAKSALNFVRAVRGGP